MKPTLENFALWFNTNRGTLARMSTFADIYAEEIKGSFLRQFHREDDHAPVSMSGLGKPAVMTAMKKLGYAEDPPTVSLHYLFHLGDIFEAYVTAAMNAWGIPCVGYQRELSYRGVTGHIDFICEEFGHSTLVDAKTMSHWYFTEFCAEPNDNRGYITQLALYSKLLDLPEPAWVCLDKEKCLIKIVRMNQDLVEPAMARVDNIITRLERVNEFEDILTQFKAPPPRAQIRKGVENGNYLLPPSMYGWKYNPVFYKLAVEKDTTYVIGINDAREARQALYELEEP